MKFIKGKIISTGSYVPEKVLTNFDLEKMVETSDEWITKRSGIERRHISADTEYASTLGIKASLDALKKIDFDPLKIDMILTATNSPDRIFPGTSCLIQKEIGASNAGSYDIQYGCSGFLAALITAYQFLSSGMYKNILVVGTETLSKFVDWTDRNTCILFGDGAAAAIVSSEPEAESGLMSAFIKTSGEHSELIEIPAGGSAKPTSGKTIEDKGHFIKMQGNDVFKIAVNCMSDAVKNVLDSVGLSIENLSYLIPHQANIRIINFIGRKLKIQKEKVLVNIQEYGNTSAASIPLALDEFNNKGTFKDGDSIALVAFGAGLGTASCLLKW